VELSLCFCGAVLEVRQADFYEAVTKLNRKSHWREEDKQEAIRVECDKRVWLERCFSDYNV
jgi:hypothetical protein